MPDSKSENLPAPGFMQAGLLLEAAQQQQHAAEAVLSRLTVWTADLDAVLRDSIRQVLVQELQSAGEAARKADASLQAVRRHASLRVGLWSVSLMAACTAVPVSLAWVLVPSRSQVEGLRQQYQDFSAGVQRLRAQGGGIDVRRCGPAPRLCVRVDRKAPVYGESADYLVIKGY